MHENKKIPLEMQGILLISVTMSPQIPGVKFSESYLMLSLWDTNQEMPFLLSLGLGTLPMQETQLGGRVETLTVSHIKSFSEIASQCSMDLQFSYNQKYSKPSRREMSREVGSSCLERT